MFRASLFQECVGLVNRWIPKEKYHTHDEYKKDLMDFLHNNFLYKNLNVQINKEANRSLCDIAVGHHQVGIELKRDLKSKSQIDRLMGQLERYEDEYTEGIIIVLVGDVDKYAENQLRHQIARKLNKERPLGFVFPQRPPIKVINRSNEKIQSEKIQSSDRNPSNPFF